MSLGVRARRPLQGRIRVAVAGAALGRLHGRQRVDLDFSPVEPGA